MYEKKKCFSVIERAKVHHFRELARSTHESLEEGASVVNHRNCHLRVIEYLRVSCVSDTVISHVFRENESPVTDNQ